jgi:hypothetical protein
VTSHFFTNLFPPGLAQECSIGTIFNFEKIRGDIHSFVFIAGVNATGNIFIAAVIVTGDKLSPAIKSAYLCISQSGHQVKNHLKWPQRYT